MPCNVLLWSSEQLDLQYDFNHVDGADASKDQYWNGVEQYFAKYARMYCGGCHATFDQRHWIWMDIQWTCCYHLGERWNCVALQETCSGMG